MDDLLTRLDRCFPRHSDHPGAPQNVTALMHAGDKGVCDSKLDMGMVLHRQQSAVGLALIGEGADLNRPLAWRDRTAPSGCGVGGAS
jgi:hypothetical protein